MLNTYGEATNHQQDNAATIPPVNWKATDLLKYIIIIIIYFLLVMQRPLVGQPLFHISNMQCVEHVQSNTQTMELVCILRF